MCGPIVVGLAPRAYAPPMDWVPASSAGAPAVRPGLEEAARRSASEAAAVAIAALPDGLDAEYRVLDGIATAVLAEASAQVDLLVAGSRGYGPLRSLMAGGVSRGLAHTAACPLLVVPRRAAAEEPLASDVATTTP